jgi:hypothetical protein
MLVSVRREPHTSDLSAIVDRFRVSQRQFGAGRNERV